MHSLPLFVRLSGRPVILLGNGEAADAKRRLLERAHADVGNDEDTQAALAIVALDGDAADAAAARLKARGVLVNVVDRPDLCDFTLPAIVDRDPVLIAIGTGGASAGLAKALRQRLDALLPAGLGGLASAMSTNRAAIRARWPNAGARRRAIDDALVEGGVLDPLVGPGGEEVNAWLHRDGGTDAAGQIEHIRLTSFEPDDLTLRTARLLGRADALWHQGDVPDAILNRARADAVRCIAPTPPPAPASGTHVWLEFAA